MMDIPETINSKTNTYLPDDFELSDEFVDAFNKIESTDEHIFITGKAGTGKSTLLQYCRENTHKKIVVLAPTGVAAIKARGQTIHSFFRLPPRLIQKDNIKKICRNKIIQKIDTIIIDEVSMLRADILDGIDHSLRINREIYDLPFGGVQMIFIGDLFQLPPVVDRDMQVIMRHKYKTPYFFSAEVMAEIELGYFELTKIYRQKDEEFISILNNIRARNITETEIKLINKRYIPKTKVGSKGVITLTTTNYSANKINERRLKSLHDKEYSYEADISDKYDESSYPTEKIVKLKEKAQVMIIMNDPEKRWVNGTLGEITRLGEDVIEVTTEDGVYEIPRAKWDKIRYEHNDDENKIEAKVIGTFMQYPLKLAWAITIHKSQGQTFDKLAIDIGRGAFAHGQVYVALSRAKTLEGITLTQPIIDDDIIFDDRIHAFLDKCVQSNTCEPETLAGDEEIEVVFDE